MVKGLLPLLLVFGLVSAGPAGASAPELQRLRVVSQEAPAALGERAVTDQILVRYRAPSSGSARAAARARANVHRVRTLPAPEWELVDPGPGESTDDVLARLKADPSVAQAIPDLRVYPTDVTPNDTYFTKQWALHNEGQAYYQSSQGTPDADVDAPAAWATSTGSSSVVVAVIDTGVAYDHLDLDANIWSNPDEIAGNGLDDDGNGYIDDVRGWDWVGNDNAPYDGDLESPHGSHVAGIIAAEGGNGYGVSGVGWNTKIMPLRVLGSGGGSISDILDAMSYAAQEGADVVNLSLGATAQDESEASALNALFNDVMEAAPDVLFVAAAGNTADNNDATSNRKALYPCAATSANMICVAATDHDDALADFSSYGATSVDLGAPGDMILSTGGPTELWYMRGTSMATPMVAGAAGVMLGVDPTATPAQLKTALLSSGDSTATLAGKTVSGRRLNLAGAVVALLDPPIFADVGPSHTHYSNIQTIHPGITSGCATDPLRYCPSSNVTRGQMAVFLIRAMELEDQLQPYQGVFADVPSSRGDARYIELLWEQGITSGCQAAPKKYCPGASVTRAQMAVFLIRAMDHAHAFSSYQGFFGDVLATHSMAGYIEHLYEHSVTGGCDADRFCPSSAVTRGQMATFLVRAFGL